MSAGAAASRLRTKALGKPDASAGHARAHHDCRRSAQTVRADEESAPTRARTSPLALILDGSGAARTLLEAPSARASEVTHLLIADGMRPASLSAAAYGASDPVFENSDKKGRSMNRRIEITVQPNIDEEIWIPGTK